jgi:hypothetical protein
LAFRSTVSGGRGRVHYTRASIRSDRPHCGEILGDIANYTDIVPVVQVSQVVVERLDRCVC